MPGGHLAYRLVWHEGKPLSESSRFKANPREKPFHNEQPKSRSWVRVIGS